MGGVAQGLRWILRVSVPVYAVVMEFDLLKPWIDLEKKPTLLLILSAVYVLGLVLLVILEHYREGAALDEVGRRISKVQGTFAGSLERLVKVPQSKLNDAECRIRCVPILHRILDLANILYANDGSVDLRVTLAVPYDAAGEGALRIWCYDASYDNKQFSILPAFLPGAPVAYRTKRASVIEDIRTKPKAKDFHDRAFRSVMSIPVQADGEVCAVVNIDATRPNFFHPDDVAGYRYTILLPMVKAVGIALHQRRQKVPYEFR